MHAMGRRKRLNDLRPKWVERGLEWGGGTSFDCPFHCEKGRVTVFFSNGLAAYSFEGPTCLWRYGNSFGDLSLHGIVDARPHFYGTMTDGWLTEMKTN